LLIERIVPNTITRFEAVDKPFCVKSGNIGASACGDDCGGLGFDLLAGGGCYFDFIGQFVNIISSLKAQQPAITLSGYEAISTAYCQFFVECLSCSFIIFVFANVEKISMVWKIYMILLGRNSFVDYFCGSVKLFKLNVFYIN